VNRRGKLALGVLSAIHAAAGFAGFLAPYEPSTQHREHALAAPTRIVLRGLTVTAVLPAPGGTSEFPVRWLRRTEDGWHLFTVDEPGKIFLLGTDSLGRDQWSRLLHGARISLFSGVLAALLAGLIGTVLGLLAGYYSGWCDRVVTQVGDIFLALPWLYLLLGARAALPLDASPLVVLSGLLAVMGIAGWPRPARLVRGMALSLRERHYVMAARGFGAGHTYILTRHILPPVWPAVAEFVCLAIPQFVMAEVTLSFLGLGLSEPAASWGTMLAAFARLDAMTGAPWLAAPAAALALVSLCYRGLLSSGTRRGGGEPERG